jgi:5-methylcytosine-specific restriction endonuclease McrA
MIVIGSFTNEQILPFIGKDHNRKTFRTNDGVYDVNMSSNRLECLKRNQTCVYCHKQGTIWRLETSIARLPKVGLSCFIDDCPWCSLQPSKLRANQGEITPHLNLYHVGVNGKLTMLTFDHIIPRALGGIDDVSNGQTLCEKCNQKKGCQLIPAGAELPFTIRAA